LTETILLGNVAMRAGKKLEWDGENMKFTTAPDADADAKPLRSCSWKKVFPPMLSFMPMCK
jgi:hypothetical protein